MLTRALPRPAEIARIRPVPGSRTTASSRLGAPPHPRPGAYYHRETMAAP
jgi:hypothetical protein